MKNLYLVEADMWTGEISTNKVPYTQMGERCIVDLGFSRVDINEYLNKIVALPKSNGKRGSKIGVYTFEHKNTTVLRRALKELYSNQVGIYFLFTLNLENIDQTPTPVEVYYMPDGKRAVGVIGDKLSDNARLVVDRSVLKRESTKVEVISSKDMLEENISIAKETLITYVKDKIENI